MWGKVPDGQRKKFLEDAILFTGNAQLYGKYMLRVAKEWPISCEQNLTDYSQNRRAWIGHAACALAMKCPEDIVREAWSYLSEKQQIAANAEADKAIEEWENLQWRKLDSE